MFHRRKIIRFGRKLSPIKHSDHREDWEQADPAWIAEALSHATSLPSGGWYVLDGSRSIRDVPKVYTVKGQEYVAWRDRGALKVAPNTCPHMGARLSEGKICEGRLVCPWHGLSLGDTPHGVWAPLPAYDDGVFAWLQLPSNAPTKLPILPPRPSNAIEAVIRIEAACDPRDVIANRLDPWHGAHFHPYSFARLDVTERSLQLLQVRVAKRILGPICVEVDATFRCPDPCTIVMTIIGGEGLGSVVETHATPIGAGQTAIIEAVLASSDREGFKVARKLAKWIRPLMQREAMRLWIDDVAYAERRHELRQQKQTLEPDALGLADS